MMRRCCPPLEELGEHLLVQLLDLPEHSLGGGRADLDLDVLSSTTMGITVRRRPACEIGPSLVRRPAGQTRDVAHEHENEQNSTRQ